MKFLLITLFVVVMLMSIATAFPEPGSETFDSANSAAELEQEIKVLVEGDGGNIIEQTETVATIAGSGFLLLVNVYPVPTALLVVLMTLVLSCCCCCCGACLRKAKKYDLDRTTVVYKRIGEAGAIELNKDDLNCNFI